MTRKLEEVISEFSEEAQEAIYIMLKDLDSDGTIELANLIKVIKEVNKKVNKKAKEDIKGRPTGGGGLE